MKHISTFLLALVLSLVTYIAHGAEYSTEDAAKGVNNFKRVQDQTNTLSPGHIDNLTAAIKSYEQKTGNELGIVIVKSLNDKPVQTVALQTAQQMGIGKKDKNNGILIFMSMSDKKISIQVGSGLEGAYPDIFAKRAIDGAKPYFKDKKFYEGLLSILKDVEQKTSGEFSQSEKDKIIAEDQAKKDANAKWWFWFWIIVIALCVLDIITAPWKEFLILGFILEIALSLGGSSGGGFSGGDFGGGGSGGGWD